MSPAVTPEPKPRVDALDARHRIAFGINDGEIRRVADGFFGLRQGQVGRVRQVDRARAFIGVGIGQQAIERHLAETRIGAEPFAVEEGALLRLHQHVDALHRIECREIEALCDFQHLQHGESGRVRRRLGDAEAAVADLDRRLFLRLARLKIACVDQHAGLAHAGEQAGRQHTAIERCGTVGGDLLQRARPGPGWTISAPTEGAPTSSPPRNTFRLRASVARNARTSPAKCR